MRRPVVIGIVPAVLAIAIGLAMLALAGAAPAASSCADRVLEDWAADEHVGAGYPVTCYRDALAKMPSDLKAYSSAPGDIARALHRKLASPPRALGTSTPGSGTDVRHVLLVLGGVLVVSVLVLGSAARRSRR